MDSRMLNSYIELKSSLARSLDEYNDEEKRNLSLVFEEEYRGKMTTHDLVDHFEKAALRRGLEEDESVRELICELKAFSKRHRDLIKGVAGEHWALRATKALRIPHAVLSNLEIDHEGRHCECDQVVFTEYGIFVVEVKNLSGEVLIDSHGLLRHARNNYAPGYGIGARCLEKETLVWETLANGGFEGVKRADVHSILLFVNRNSEIRDDFKRIKVCRQDDICYHIQDFSRGSAAFSAEENVRMSTFLAEIHSPMEIDHLEEFSFLRSRIEAVMSLIDRCDESVLSCEPEESATPQSSCEKKARPNWLGNVFCLGAGFAIGLATSFAALSLKTVRDVA